MSNYTPYSLKHFTALRKLLKNKQSGNLSFQISSGERRVIQIEKSTIIHHTEEELQATLNKFFSETIVSFSWQRDNIVHQGQGRTPVILAICQCLNHVQWHPAQLQRLSFEFSKLPSIHVRMVALHQYAFNDSLLYLQFYQHSLLRENYKPIDFLQNNSMQLQRIRVLVLSYSLNLFVPRMHAASQKKQSAQAEGTKQGVNHNQVSQNTGAQPSGQTSLAERILQRIRGI
ncbi:MAG: hypothetical protein Q9M28_09355 [Mariprofundaceae bacterium]|nr:hypothetical protein [Mariprofundaceae bacterium]